MSKITEASRDHITDENFAFPKERKEPIHDAAHVRNAIARFKQVQGVTDAERDALGGHDYVALFELGAHTFLLLTLFIAMFERDYAEPLAFQREFAARLGHWKVPYPDIST